MSRSVASLLAGIPGWEHASHEELTGGLTNRTFLVDRGDKRAVLKIDDGPRSAPYNTRSQEARVQTAAANNGLASRVLFAEDNVYMTDYLEGDVWTVASLDEDTNLLRLAKALRQLHSLPLTGRSFDARQAARRYAAGISSAHADRTDDCVQVIDAMPRLRNVCCCHNDLVVGNIVAVPDIRFLDWEYACDNDPFFDLATVVAHHGLPAERAEVFLDAYFDGDGARWRDRLATYERAYVALLWLWEKADL